LVFGCGRKGKEEGRPVAGRELRPNAATMTLDDALHDGQTHAATLELLRAVQALKGLKQPISVRHVERCLEPFFTTHVDRVLAKPSTLSQLRIALAEVTV
jgi:hypothetical protein